MLVFLCPGGVAVHGGGGCAGREDRGNARGGGVVGLGGGAWASTDSPSKALSRVISDE